MTKTLQYSSTNIHINIHTYMQSSKCSTLYTKTYKYFSNILGRNKRKSTQIKANKQITKHINIFIETVIYGGRINISLKENK